MPRAGDAAVAIEPEGNMLAVRRRAAARSFIVAVATLLAAVLTSAPLGPGAGAAGASPGQQDPHQDDDLVADEESADDPALADLDVANADPAEIAGALVSLQGDVRDQLDQLDVAQSAVAAAESDLADAQSVVDDTEMRIEELQVRSDSVVVEAFVNPPTDTGVEVFGADTLEDATVQQAILDIHAQDSADTLAELEEQTAALETQREDQEAALGDANAARSDAEAALADLESAVSAQTRFVLEVRQRLESGEGADASDPELAEQLDARRLEIQAALDEAQAAAEYAVAMEALAEAQRRREEMGIWECPVQGGNLNFADTWGASRSGGRAHQGTDMMADRGTETVAPVSGTVEHRENGLGGLTWYVYGDNGDTYYGAHLDAYENVGAGHVERGTVIGYVGDTGNAAGTPPHLHFEYQPGGGSSVNPYERLVNAC